MDDDPHNRPYPQADGSGTHGDDHHDHQQCYPDGDDNPQRDTAHPTHHLFRRALAVPHRDNASSARAKAMAPAPTPTPLTLICSLGITKTWFFLPAGVCAKVGNAFR